MNRFQKLDRAELKNILGGMDSLSNDGGCPDTCQTDADCKDGKTCTMGGGAFGCDMQKNCNESF
jgi:hypothetical protein